MGQPYKLPYKALHVWSRGACGRNCGSREGAVAYSPDFSPGVGSACQPKTAVSANLVPGRAEYRHTRSWLLARWRATHSVVPADLLGTRQAP